MKEIQHKTKRTLMENDVPNMVELQLDSYNWFLDKGMKELFRSFSPITSRDHNKYSLEFMSYTLDEPKLSEAECRYRDHSTYAAPIKIDVQLTEKDDDGNIKKTTTDQIYFGELPIMTDKGTFVINGAERVVVSQLTRSPGAYFEDNIDISGTMLYIGRIIPGHGCWLEVETDSKNVMQAHLAQSAKFPLTLLLRAISLLDETCPVYLPSLIGTVLKKDIKHPITGEVLVSCSKGKKETIFTKDNYETVKKALTDLYTDENSPYKDYVMNPDYIYDKELGQSTSTTIDILDIFGEKTNIFVEKRYKCKTFYSVAQYDKENKPVLNKKTNKIIKDPFVVIPAEDPTAKLNKAIRVLAKDLYMEGVDEPYAKAGSFITKKLIDEIKKDADKEIRKNYTEYSIEGMRPVNTVCLAKSEDSDKYKIVFKDQQLKKEDIEKDDIKVLCMAGEVIDHIAAEAIYTWGGAFLEVYNVDAYINETLKTEKYKANRKDSDKTHEVADSEEAVNSFYTYMRPSDPVDTNSSIEYLKGYLFDNTRYDVGIVGRYKLNKKLLLDLPQFSSNYSPCRSITKDDLIQLIKYIIALNHSGLIVYFFDSARRDEAIKEIDSYISDKEAALSADDRKLSTIIPGKELYNLNRFRKQFAECRKGYMFKKEDYEDFIRTARTIPYKNGTIADLVSDSPETLIADVNAIRLKQCSTDEIDHLENKRVRSIGELLQEQLRDGFNKLKKNCQEKMQHPVNTNPDKTNNRNPNEITPNFVITNKPITSVLRSFFGSSQLSQFMDQTNPLAELTHKRRLSALGPGGLSRQSAKLEVRDVHSSHYGRICPVETPEGPNIGLIGSMAIQAKIDEYGFLKTPYRKVVNGKITDEIKEYSADDETNEYIATANTRTNENGEFVDPIIRVRYNGNYKSVEKDKVTLIDVSPNQIMSVAANLIPFIENDDANRALMGSNMQRQAVPLLRPTAPIVRTGVEGRAAHDSGVELLSKRSGKIVWTSGRWILIKPDEENTIDTYTVYSKLRDGQSVNEKDPAIMLAVSRKADKNSKYPYLPIKNEVLAPIKRNGRVSIIVLNGKKTIVVEPTGNTITDCDFEDDSYLNGIEQGDLIMDGKVFDHKYHELKKDAEYGDIIEFKYNEKIPDGKVISVFEGNNTAEDGSINTVYTLKIQEFDYYPVEPAILRSTFPAGHTLFNVNEYKAKAENAGMGTGADGAIKVIQQKPLEYSFDVVLCDSYRLYNMVRSNQNTCINSIPAVRVGDKVEKDQLLADGPCTNKGELALGQNVMVAFMPWNGFNYEDAILLNQRLVKDDKFTSVHIVRYETEARDTKLGPEEITKDIPNTGEEAVKNLNDNGIVKIGAAVHADDILAGKTAPKTKAEDDPASKLLSIVFGTKAEEKKDVSLRLPHGESGIVVDVKVFSRYKYVCTNSDCRHEYEYSKKPDIPEDLQCSCCGSPLKENKDKDADELNAGTNQLVRVYIAQKRKIMQGDKMAGRHGNKGVISNILPECDMPYLPDGTPVDIVLNPLGVPSRMNIGQILETHQGIAGDYLNLKFKNPIFQGSKEAEIIADLIVMTNLKKLRTLKNYLIELELDQAVAISDSDIQKAEEEAIRNLENLTAENIKTEAAAPIDKLYTAAIDSIMETLRDQTVYTPRCLEIFSQKIGGAPVLDAEDCNRLSYCKELRYKSENCDLAEHELLAAKISEIESSIDKHASIPEDYDYELLIDIIKENVDRRVGFKAEMAKTDLYDGRTGEKMEQPVAVGIIYMLKLSHLVDDKIHARATGPYSLVTQQPLGGKAQFGGQRFGEMEVWALEAYGAAYTLQEILTIKSDDVQGRMKAFESIVKDRAMINPGIPESFKILVNELQALCLKVTVEDGDKQPIDLKSTEEDSKNPYIGL